MTMYSKIVLHSNLANIIIDYTLFIIIIKKLFKISKASFTAFSYALAIDHYHPKDTYKVQQTQEIITSSTKNISLLRRIILSPGSALARHL